MLRLCDIRTQRKARKVGLEAIAKQFRCHRTKIDRMERGEAIPIFEAIATALKLNIYLLTDQEVEILAQFKSILAKNDQKGAKK
jgi:transcriptional regulator with XRE-family HTH domain